MKIDMRFTNLSKVSLTVGCFIFTKRWIIAYNLPTTSIEQPIGQSVSYGYWIKSSIALFVCILDTDTLTEATRLQGYPVVSGINAVFCLTLHPVLIYSLNDTISKDRTVPTVRPIESEMVSN